MRQKGLLFVGWLTLSWAFSLIILAEEPIYLLLPGRMAEVYQQRIPHLLRDQYNLKLDSGAPSPDFQWRLAGGEMPPGLELKADGTLTGIPQAHREQPYRFRVKVVDNALREAEPLEIEFNLAVKPPQIRLVKANAVKLVPISMPIDQATPTPNQGETHRSVSVKLDNEIQKGKMPSEKAADLTASAQRSQSVAELTSRATPRNSASNAGLLKGNGAAGGTSADSSKPASVDDLDKKRGLVGLTIGGAVFSQQAQNFSQSDPFFGFITGYTSDVRNADARSANRFNIRFQGLFTADPQTAKAPKLGSPADFKDFIASRKTFDTEIHGWWEFYPYKHRFVGFGPYFAIGGSTALSKKELQGEDITIDENGQRVQLDTSKVQVNNNIHKYFEFGGLANFYNGTNEGPKLFVQTILAYGKYDALGGLAPNHNTKNRFIGKLRIFPNGLELFSLGKGNIKGAPMFGVDLNAGYGPDQIKFFVGMAVQLKPLEGE